MYDCYHYVVNKDEYILHIGRTESSMLMDNEKLILTGSNVNNFSGKTTFYDHRLLRRVTCGFHWIA